MEEEGDGEEDGEEEDEEEEDTVELALPFACARGPRAIRLTMIDGSGCGCEDGFCRK